MRKLFTLASLAVAGAACQQEAPATKFSAATTAASPAQPASASALPAASVPSLFKPGDTLDRAGREVLRRHDLSQLWQGHSQQRQTPILEGVFGPDHYRFELTFQHVERDPKRPDYYRVQGKCHYRKNVRPFTGWLVMRQLWPLEMPYEENDGSLNPPHQEVNAADPSSLDSAEARDRRFYATIKYYEVRAEVRLAEQAAPNSGELRGEALLNFYVTPTGRLGFAPAPIHPGDGIWREGALLVRGTRLNVTTRQLKPFVVSDNVFVAGAYVYQDFGIGDRSYETEINPKYRHLGWNEKWENEEWWNDLPTPKLEL